MPLDLASLVAPSTTAVVTSECQHGVIGADSVLPELAAAARESVIPNGARICAAARVAGVSVVHCVAGRRPDDRGSNRNARLFKAMLKATPRLDFGSKAVEVVDEFALADSDIVLSRMHGVGPMTGTDVDSVLRNLGVRTMVVIGVSLNVAIPNLVFDAVNSGYQVVVVRDAVAGVPAEHGESVLTHTLSMLATIVTTDELLAAWTP